MVHIMLAWTKQSKRRCECKADSVRPNLDQAGKTHDEVTPALNYIPVSYLIFDEVIDSTPASYVDLSKITIMDFNNSNKRSLAGSTVTELDRNTVKILLNTPAMQHALSILDEAESLEMQINKPIQINIFEGAVRDLAGNPNNPLTEIELLDHNNSRGVPIVKVYPLVNYGRLLQVLKYLDKNACVVTE